MDIDIRPATSNDIDSLKAFEAKLVGYERKIEPGLKQDGELKYYDIQSIISDTTRSIILIAEVNGIPIGCGMGQIRTNEPFYNKSEYGYIGFMYVEDEYRGKKVGASIIDRLVQWFTDKEISEITLKVYASNHGAINAYQKYGFEPFVQEMKLSRKNGGSGGA